MDHIEELSKNVMRRFEQPSIDPDVAASVREYLRDVGIERHDILRDDAYEQFALSHLKREVARFRRDGERPDVDGERDDLLCHCTDSDCPLKNGTLPATVRNAESIEEGILEFKREHPGYPAVLDEISSTWGAKVQHVEDSLTTALIALNQQVLVDELPGELTANRDADEQDFVAEAV